MIKSINEKEELLEIDLTGPEGNAFVLLEYAKQFCKKHELDEGILDRMMSSDYENLVAEFEKAFKYSVILYR